MLNVLAWLCYIFAVVDFGLSFFGVDITGVQWSPVAAGGLGGIFQYLAGKNSNTDGSENNSTSENK